MGCFATRLMLADEAHERGRSATKSAGIRDLYRQMLGTCDLSDQEIGEMRKHVVQLAQTLCEHIWGKGFY